jgi:hypothetical protein
MSAIWTGILNFLGNVLLKAVAFFLIFKSGRDKQKEIELENTLKRQKQVDSVKPDSPDDLVKRLRDGGF